MYEEGNEVLNIIKGMYHNSLACARVRKGESELFMINGNVKEGCVMSHVTWIS